MAIKACTGCGSGVAAVGEDERATAVHQEGAMVIRTACRGLVSRTQLVTSRNGCIEGDVSGRGEHADVVRVAAGAEQRCASLVLLAFPLWHRLSISSAGVRRAEHPTKANIALCGDDGLCLLARAQVLHPRSGSAHSLVPLPQMPGRAGRFVRLTRDSVRPVDA